MGGDSKNPRCNGDFCEALACVINLTFGVKHEAQNPCTGEQAAADTGSKPRFYFSRGLAVQSICKLT